MDFSDEEDLDESKGNAQLVDIDDGPPLHPDADKMFHIGQHFSSFEDFTNLLDQYCALTYVQFIRTCSMSMDYRLKIFKKGNKMDVNHELKFSKIKFVCIAGGKKGPSESKGIRKVTSRKVGCPVHIYLRASPDLRTLIIKSLLLRKHNHPIDQVDYYLKNLDEDTENEIHRLITTHGNKKLARNLILDRLSKEIGIRIPSRSLMILYRKIGRRLDWGDKPEPSLKENGSESIDINGSPDHSDGEEMVTEDDQDLNTPCPDTTTVNEASADLEEGNMKTPSQNNSLPAAHNDYPKVVTKPVEFTMSTRSKAKSPTHVRKNYAAQLKTLKVSLSRCASATKEVKNVSKNTAMKSPPPQSTSRTAADSAVKAGVKRKLSIEAKPGIPEKKSAGTEDRKLAVLEELLVLEKKKAKMFPIQEQLLKFEKEKMSVLENISKKLDKILLHLETNSKKNT